MSDTSTIIARGQLRHCFFGNYSAQLVLQFGSPEECLAAIPLLNPAAPGTYSDACGNVRPTNGWRVHSKQPDVAIIHAADKCLEAVLDILVSHGAKRKDITSMARSIDHGLPFTISIFRAPQPVQLSLL